MRAKPFQYTLIACCLLLYLLFSTNTSQAKSFERNTNYTTCFSPKGQCAELIASLIDHAKSNIELASYSFTSWPIARALIRAQKRGVHIKILTDRSQFKNKSLIPELMTYDIPIRVDDSVTIAHNKYIIVDDSQLETGSFNYTVSANRYNAENVLIINSSALAHRYHTNFSHRFLKAIPASNYHYHPAPYYDSRNRRHKHARHRTIH